MFCLLVCNVLQVDFLQLQMNTLRRYKRHYKLQLKPGTNKIQLVEVCMCVCVHLPSSDILSHTVAGLMIDCV